MEIVDEERLLFCKFSEVNSSSLGTHCPRRHHVLRIWRDKNIPILPESAMIAEAANCCNLTEVTKPANKTSVSIKYVDYKVGLV